jgi:hypothetical protein
LLGRWRFRLARVVAIVALRRHQRMPARQRRRQRRARGGDDQRVAGTKRHVLERRQDRPLTALDEAHGHVLQRREQARHRGLALERMTGGDLDLGDELLARRGLQLVRHRAPRLQQERHDEQHIDAADGGERDAEAGEAEEREAHVAGTRGDVGDEEVGR